MTNLAPEIEAKEPSNGARSPRRFACAVAVAAGLLVAPASTDAAERPPVVNRCGAGCTRMAAFLIDPSTSSRGDPGDKCASVAWYVRQFWNLAEDEPIMVAVQTLGNKKSPEPEVVVPWTEISAAGAQFSPAVAARRKEAALADFSAKCRKQLRSAYDSSPVAAGVRGLVRDVRGQCAYFGATLNRPCLQPQVVVLSDGRENVDEAVVAAFRGKSAHIAPALASGMRVTWCGLSETTEGEAKTLQGVLARLFVIEASGLNFTSTCPR